MRGSGQGDHLDFLAFPGHKMYAPFGAGVLLGDARLLAATAPDEIGGGTVDFVTAADYDLAAEPFRRENSGTPNAVGIVAVAVAAQVLKWARLRAFPTRMPRRERCLRRIRPRTRRASSSQA